MFVLSLLFSFTDASYAALKTELLAVGPRARLAVVRVHSDGFVSIALCPLRQVGPTRLDFAAVESLAGCRPGGARLPDTPAARARFDREFEALAERVRVDTADARSLPRIAATSAAIGVIGTAVTYAIAPGARLLPQSNRLDRLALAAIPGYFGAVAAALVGLNQGVRAIEAEQTARYAASGWTGAPDAAWTILIPGQYAFETLVSIIDEAMARAVETGAG